MFARGTVAELRIRTCTGTAVLVLVWHLVGNIEHVLLPVLVYTIQLYHSILVPVLEISSGPHANSVNEVVAEYTRLFQ